MSPSAQDVQQTYDRFLDGFQSVVLATVDGDGKPAATYAPFVVDDDGVFWCLVSGMSAHTGNVEATGVASALFVEDEAGAQQIFARKRLSFDCEAAVLPRDDPAFAGVAERFAARFGGIAEQIASMPDFRPLRLRPGVGHLVLGFGAAYRIEGGVIQQVTGGGGHGHGHGGGHGHGHGGHGGGGDGALDEAAVAAILGHMNGDHASAVLHYAKAHGGRADAEAAELTGLDGDGMDLSVRTPGGTVALRVPFPRPITTRGEARQVLMDLARAPAPDAPASDA